MGEGGGGVRASGTRVSRVSGGRRRGRQDGDGRGRGRARAVAKGSGNCSYCSSGLSRLLMATNQGILPCVHMVKTDTHIFHRGNCEHMAEYVPLPIQK